MTPNPFTLVYDALWTLILRNPNFVNDVKEGNCIKFNSATDRAPKKDTVAAGDLPEVLLVPEAGTANHYNTSSTSAASRQYAWMIQTGDWRANEYIHQVEWHIFAAMTGWTQTLGALTWQGDHFVKRASVVGVTVGQSDPQRNRGIEGWSAIWRCQVDMVFKTSDLINILTPPGP